MVRKLLKALWTNKIEGGSEKHFEGAAIRNTEFQQLAEQGISPTLVAGGGADGAGVAPAESGRPVGVGEGGAEMGRPSPPGLATSKEEGKREVTKREETLSMMGCCRAPNSNICKATASKVYSQGKGNV